MTRLLPLVLSIAALVAAVPASAENIYEVEGARANARAGGPISEHDAWLLERYGATSGTPDWRGRPRYSTFEFWDDERPRRHKHRRRIYRD